MATDKMDAILGRLGSAGADNETVVSSVRLPVALRDAARALHELGVAPSFNEVLVQGARDRILALVHRGGLDAHYAHHPDVRPSPAAVAMALARMDGSELADHPDVIEQAAAELGAGRDDLSGDDVLVYAAALFAHRPV